MLTWGTCMRIFYILTDPTHEDKNIWTPHTVDQHPEKGYGQPGRALTRRGNDGGLGTVFRGKSQTKKKEATVETIMVAAPTCLFFFYLHLCLPPSSVSSRLDWRRSLPPRNSQSRDSSAFPTNKKILVVNIEPLIFTRVRPRLFSEPTMGTDSLLPHLRTQNILMRQS